MVEAILRTLLVRKRLQIAGFHGCLENCRNQLSRRYFSYHSLEKEMFTTETLSQSIRLAAPFVQGKIKCLEFSLILIDMLVIRNIRPALHIGFQRYDLLSHAWLEINNNVVSEDENLKTKLTPIISVI